MLGIFSWNIGENAGEKIPRYIREIKTKCKLPDLLVFGFQEVSQDLTPIMQKELPEYEIINGITACTQLTKYQIVTFVMQKNTMTSSYTNTIVKRECLSSEGEENMIMPGTKGYTINVIKGPQNFIFVNAHFPLKNTDILQDFYTLISFAIDKLKLPNYLVFVFGDINSRCFDYQKEVKTCANDADQNLDYCQAKKQLEKLPFKQTHNFASLSTPQDSVPLITQLITTLTTQDYINKNKNNNKNVMFNGYTEPEIRFLPTYKRDVKTGEFYLVKPAGKMLGIQLSQNEEKDGRLPGYADRIFYRNNKNIKCLNYGSFGVTGNDHLPIGGIFTITTTGGRLRKKSRARSKSRKAQKKSRSKSRTKKITLK